ncbi:MAG: lipid-A-disaccharide synthase [Verrucomicrobiota bacterium]
MSETIERPKILMIAGESSGDHHGATLIRALRVKNPLIEVIGTGGTHMLSAGQRQLFDMTEHAVVGLIEVGKHYTKFRRFFQQLLTLALTEKPKAIVLIDYPGFNLRFAEAIKRQAPGIPVIQYISPQVWAWKSGRAKAMEASLDSVMTIFPFEQEWLQKHAPRLQVKWVGHPTMDRLLPIAEEYRDEKRIALLPGSRADELKKHFPILFKAAHLMSQRIPDLKFVWVAPDEKTFELGNELLNEFSRSAIHLESYIGYSLTHLSRCKLAMVASGTASLECALAGTPPIVVYKVNPFTFAVGKRLVKVKHLSMINVLAKESLVPELLQKDLTAPRLAQETHRLLIDTVRYQMIRERMKKIVETLGEPGVAERAADWVLSRIQG